MSGIPVIGKIFDAIKKNKILKVIVIAVVIYFTVGAAMEYFAASGASTAAAGGSMAATTAASTAGATAAGATTAAATGTALTAGATTAATVAAPAIAAPAVAGTAAASTAAAAGTTAATGVTGWMAANPMATMMLGQGVAGAAASHEEKKTQEAAIAQRDKERKERGLFGFDYEGNSAGVVSSAMQPTGMIEEQQAQAVAAPVVASQQIAGVQPVSNAQMVPTQIPIQRKDLPKLNQQGQLAIG